ncbi:cell division protein [Phenylobacterium sp.]|uniref:cell division protein FtsL n=1 Tax=Phenylobacterium sp. TaxID=1871053 RepID=UPI002732938A|nr:cell division protein [Phenylobacterium sp.]MDP3852383.1 cell division protein [Phenylobacterium sp.]
MSVFSRKIRGFRLIDVVAAGLLVAIILSVYLAKTIAGRERTEIAMVEKQIDAERDRIRLLQAEVAHLEQPSRIEKLSTAHLGMAPTIAKNEITPEKLGEIVLAAHLKSAAAAAAAAPAPVEMAAPAPSDPATTPTQVAHVAAPDLNQ